KKNCFLKRRWSTKTPCQSCESETGRDTQQTTVLFVNTVECVRTCVRTGSLFWHGTQVCHTSGRHTCASTYYFGCLSPLVLEPTRQKRIHTTHHADTEQKRNANITRERRSRNTHHFVVTQHHLSHSHQQRPHILT
ncbi:unnamed protein product, partial [Ectocarpus fasciculatus]